MQPSSTNFCPLVIKTEFLRSFAPQVAALASCQRRHSTPPRNGCLASLTIDSTMRFSRSLSIAVHRAESLRPALEINNCNKMFCSFTFIPRLKIQTRCWALCPNTALPLTERFLPLIFRLLAFRCRLVCQSFAHPSLSQRLQRVYCCRGWRKQRSTYRHL